MAVSQIYVVVWEKEDIFSGERSFDVDRAFVSEGMADQHAWDLLKDDFPKFVMNLVEGIDDDGWNFIRAEDEEGSYAITITVKEVTLEQRLESINFLELVGYQANAPSAAETGL